MTIPIWILNLLTAVFNGWGNALLFVGSSTYVNACANDHNKGMYNAILWCGNTGSFITGNIIAAYVIPALSTQAYFYICIAILIFAMAFFLLLKDPEPQPESVERSFSFNSQGSAPEVKVDDVEDVEGKPAKDNRESLLKPEQRINNTEVSDVPQGVNQLRNSSKNLTVPGQEDLNIPEAEKAAGESQLKMTWRLFNTKRMR